MQRLLQLVVTAVLTSAAGTVAEPPQPLSRVIDDTAEYCLSLAGRLAALPAARAEPSRTLGTEGVKLCGDGHVRTGITKLRRAIRAARAQTAAAPASAAAAPASAAGGPAEARAATR